MKRLFALIGFSYLITLTVAMFLNEKIIFIILFSSIGLFLISLLIKSFRKNKSILITLATVIVAMSSYLMNMKLNVMPVRELEEKDVMISGIICELPSKRNGRYHYTINVDEVVGYEGINKFKMDLSTSNAIDADVYDRFTGNVHTYSSQQNNNFYFSKYTLAKKIYLSGFLYEYKYNKVNHTKGRKSPYYYALKFREKMLSATRSVLPEKQASVANGILLGDKHNIPEDIRNDFSDVGVYHLLTVSGIHVAIVSQILMFILKKLKIPSKLSTIISVIVTIGFMAVTGFTPSVMRAGIMSIIYLVGMMIGRNSDSLNSLGFAILLLCLFNPNVGADIRLWLSALSVLGIIVLAKPIELKLKYYFNKVFNSNRISNYVLKSVAVTLSVTVITIPVNILFFKCISLISPLSNVLMLFPISVMIFCTIAMDMGVILNLPGVITMPFALVSGTIVNYLVFCAEWLAKLTFSCISIAYPFVKLWVSCTLVLISICALFGGLKKHIKLLSFISADLLLLGIISYQFTMINVTRVSVVDTGNGLSVVLRKNGHTALISCGGEIKRCNSLGNFLKSINTKTLDLMLVPDVSEECSQFFSNIEQKYDVGTIILPDSTIIGSRLSDGNKNIKPIRFKDKLDSSIWGNIQLSVFKCDENTWMNLKIQDVDFLICPLGGDIDKLPSSYLNCDVFIAGELPINFNKINPITTVISMNSRACEVNVPKLLKYGMNTCTTSSCGAVHIDVNDSNCIAIRGNI